jgi:hypothetical protein
MAGFINGAYIGFCFNNHAAGYAVGCAVYQQTAQQFAGQFHGILSEKCVIHH